MQSINCDMLNIFKSIPHKNTVRSLTGWDHEHIGISFHSFLAQSCYSHQVQARRLTSTFPSIF